MVGDQVWNSLEIAKLLADLVTPFVVATFGYCITRRLKAQEERSLIAREKEREERQRQYEDRINLERQDREERLEARRTEGERSKERERLERETERDELERRHTPHIELRLECHFLGERNGQHLTTVLVLATNRGQVLHKFDRIILRMRGIKNERFEHWEENAPRACFPHKILETNLVPKLVHESWNFIFIEPGVAQHISLTTLIPVEYTYVLAHVEFEYKKYWPHTAEAVFAVPTGMT
jgi:hypothetical protein